MMTKKFTDEETIEALECCQREYDTDCEKCPYNKYSRTGCRGALSEDTLDLINRQKAENEEFVGNIDRLKEENGNLTVEFQSMRGAANSLKMHHEEAQAEIVRLQSMNQAKLDTIHDLQAEIERLQKEKDEYAYLYDKHINTAFSHIKSESYKEFAERLKQFLLLNREGEMSVITFENIDNLLKEMVGDEE